MTGVYAYAVVPAGSRLDPVAGVDGRPVELLSSGDLALVTSGVPDGLIRLADPEASPEALAELAQEHDAVVRSALDVTGAVLPFRLGTVLTGADAGRRLLAERAGELGGRLDRVRGCREWGVRIRDTGPGSDSGGTAQDAEPSESVGVGTAYLRRRGAALAQERDRRAERCRVAARVDDALRALALDVAAGTRRGPDLVLDESYLVPVEAEQRFLAAVDEHGDRLAADGYALRATGPWPPYSFAAVDLRTDAS